MKRDDDDEGVVRIANPIHSFFINPPIPTTAAALPTIP